MYKRRRSPSPLTCFECNGKGHLARECYNTLRKRREVGKASRKHQHRNTSSSSTSTEPDDPRARRMSHRYSLRRRHDGQRGNNLDDRRVPFLTTVPTGGIRVMSGMRDMRITEVTATPPVKMTVIGQGITTEITPALNLVASLSPPYGNIRDQ